LTLKDPYPSTLLDEGDLADYDIERQEVLDLAWDSGEDHLIVAF
jgi:hypothetical protein